MTSPRHPAAAAPPGRIVARGKFFFLGAGAGEVKWKLRGVTYGPFRPTPPDDAEMASPEIVARDFAQIAAAGFNTVRVYGAPARWLLDLAAQHGLRVWITAPSPQRGLFLGDVYPPPTPNGVSPQKHSVLATAADQHEVLRQLVESLADHPALFGYLVESEIMPDVVRWYGAEVVEEHLTLLARTVKDADPHALVTYGNYPGTEYLRPRGMDFTTFHVYLHQPAALTAYLARLHHIAGHDQPLVLGEFGHDTLAHGEPVQAELLLTTTRLADAAGVAGTVVFSWTDEWYRGGEDITGWAFGLTRADRTPKLALAALSPVLSAPAFPHWRTIAREELAWPMVSVVICVYNGAATLRQCLEKAVAIAYPRLEVIVVDDGSSDDSRAIARAFPSVRLLELAHGGLSVARNAGMEAAQGEIVAYTDSDCMADADWLAFLVPAMLEHPEWAGAGGPNLAPPTETEEERIVAAAPGAPSEVLLNDISAEHIPGCNMVFWRRVLVEMGGFDAQFVQAGDDVDLCWRLLDAGWQIGFCSAAIVWHWRRRTVSAYLAQQGGYARAEAHLLAKHPGRFNRWGAATWRGVIYTARSEDDTTTRTPLDEPSRIARGTFANGLFQVRYLKPRRTGPALDLAALAAPVVAALLGRPVLALVLLLWPLWVWIIAPWQRAFQILAGHPFTSKCTLAWLHFAQPATRMWQRVSEWCKVARQPRPPSKELRPLPRTIRLRFWNKKSRDRLELLPLIERQLRDHGYAFGRDNTGQCDLCITAGLRTEIRLTTVTEVQAGGGRLIAVKYQAEPFFWLVALMMSPFAIILVLALGALFLGSSFTGEVRWSVTAPFFMFPGWLLILLLNHNRETDAVLTLVAAAAAELGCEEVADEE